MIINKKKDFLAIVGLLVLVLFIAASCMNKKRCPGVHRYTTQAGTGKERKLNSTGISNPIHKGTSKKKYTTARYGGAVTIDSRLKGGGMNYSGGMLKDRRESPNNLGTGAWTKKNSNKDKHKAKSGIIPPNLKKPPKSKSKKSSSKKVTKSKYKE